MKQSEQPQLGKKYGGVAVTRAALEENDNDDDPFAPVEEDEDDDPFAEGGSSQDYSGASGIDTGSGSEMDEDVEAEDVAKRVQKASIRDRRGSNFEGAHQPDSDGDDVPGMGSQSGSDIDMDDILEEDDDESDASSTPEQSGPLTGRTEIQNLLKQDTARVASGISSQDDIKQGQAVKEQQAIYDRLLDARIKLQKAVTASNDLQSNDLINRDAKTAIENAEAAALSLWSTIDSIRCTLLSSQPSESSKKRKRPLTPTSNTPISDLWIHSQSLESLSLPRRRQTLNHWSTRTRASAPTQSRSKATSDREPALTDVLDEYLRKETQKLKAPASAHDAQALSESEAPRATNPPFSDTAFYQTLLRDLIASRSQTVLPSTSFPSISANPIQSSHSKVPGTKPTAVNNQRNRRQIDTKASKGRKIRYTVHEKLVGFMASEERGTWGEGARMEFFGSLFGAQSGAGIDGRNNDLNGDLGAEKITAGEEGALRLFRN